MSTNLANVYANLLRKYSECYTITYNLPPTYLTNIVGSYEVSNNKIVLVYSSKSQTNSKNFISPSKLNVKNTSNDLNLTGSPLRDDCIVEAIADMSLDMHMVDMHPWTLDEQLHGGINIDKARFIMCSEDFQNVSANTAQSGSVWFLCNAADYGKTLLLQYEFTHNYFSRGVICFAGIFPTYSVNTQTLLKLHYELISVGAPIATHIENTYNIKKNISLRCAWSSVSALPTLVDLSCCDVTLLQTFRVAECSPLTQNFLNQLRILVYIRDDILEYRKAEQDGVSKEAVYRCGRGIELDDLREQINKVMTEISGFNEATDISGGAEVDIEDIVQRASGRRLMDLTDKLWEILKCCSSYKDLKLAFNILFQCAARRNVVNTPTNKNRLAEIITELANRRLAMPCLSGVEPLELLLEIGLEKLYKDYEYIFTESKMCSANLLKNCNSADADAAQLPDVPKVRKSLHNAVRPEPTANMRKTLLHHTSNKQDNKSQDDSLVDFRNSYFDEQECATQISKLFQIHCTLEHLLLIHINLNLNNISREVCAQLLQRPLRYLETIDDTLSDAIDIYVSVHHVREHLEGRDPHARRIIMKSGNKFREVISTFYYNVENICPPEMSENFQCEDKELAKEQMYYTWIYRNIKTLKH